MKSLRDDFSMAIERTVLREECSHARQKSWKQDETLQFEINGKSIKKTDKVNK